MTDEFARLFEGLDAPRPLPADMRGRMEQRILEPALIDALASADAPRAMPDELRERLEAALTTGAGPRALPAPFRRRLERSLRRPAAVRTVGVIAAALLVLLGSVVLVTRDSSQPTHTVAGRDTSTQAGGSSVDGSADSLSGGLTSGDAGDAANAATGSGAISNGGAATATASSGAAVTIGVVGGDPDEEAGFRAYIARLSQTAGRRFNLVNESAAAMVTVNLSAKRVAAPSGRPFMDGLHAREADLRGNVFDVASVAERQAHIAASAAFPESAQGSRAIIFTDNEEPFATRVPAALEAVLRDRGVTPVRIRYNGSGTPLLPRADAAFLSLPTDSVRAWLRAARIADYTPQRGTWGVYSAADESLIGDMTASMRVVSPFSFHTSPEAAELRAATDRPLSARLIHGWVTAKFVAAAVARTGADTPSELATALANMTGYLDGFAPAYEERPGTHSRTPEGIVLVAKGAEFAQQGDFVRDRN